MRGQVYTSQYSVANVIVLLAGYWLLATGYFPLHAAGTATWEMSTYADFLRGRFSGVSLSRDGKLMLAPKLEPLFASEQPAIWSVVAAPEGGFYVGTGHRGRVYHVSADGHSTLVWTAEQPEIFALAVDRTGVLYAGTSPDGKVYRIQNGKAEVYFEPKEKYIWSLAFAPDGSGLFVGTGGQGKIYRVRAPGQGEVYYETGQANITAMAIDPQGRLLAGTEPNGILYRITAKDKAFVLYDSTLPEIRSIVPQADGRVYVAALGGSVAKRLSSITGATISTSSSATVSSPGVSITVSDAEQNPIDPKPKAEQTRQQTTTATTPVVASTVSPVIDVAGVEKSAVYRINPDNTVETLWNSKEENVYDLLTSGKQVFFSTDAQGRIYRLSGDRQVTLLAQTNEGEATRLLQSGAALVAATSTLGKLYRLEEGTGVSGFYESPVHDATTVARWGALSWRMESSSSQTGKMVFHTRSGNSARPDKTWSDWSGPLTGTDRVLVPSPNARYVQWRVEFTGVNGRAPVIDSVTVAYLPQNNPPVVKSINVTSVASASAAARTAAQASTAAASVYSITVTDTGDTTANTSAGTPSQTLNRGASSQMQISWQAEDPDGDKLVYTLWFKGEDESQWKLLRTNMSENGLLLDSDVLADGKYNFRVQASDRPANPPDVSREAELQSAPVLIDNTPPLVTARLVRRDGTRAEVSASARDAASSLRRCEYSMDASGWTPVASTDGVIDSPQEEFRLTLDSLAPGEHVVVFRVYDSAGNVGLAKVVVR